MVSVQYGTRRRVEVTGAVSKVEWEDDKSLRNKYFPPKPVGGKEAFEEHVDDNFHYPMSGREEKVKGTVRLKFTVKSNGDIANIEVLKSLGTDFDNEAIRLLKSGPKWEPARQNDVPIAREVKLKIGEKYR